MTASERVIRRRIQLGMDNLKNPSITICPANVPVIVEFCPDANRATANSVLITPPIAAPNAGSVFNA